MSSLLPICYDLITDNGRAIARRPDVARIEVSTSPVPLLVVRGSWLGLLEWHRPVLSFVPQDV
jgi:hypothetical protein